MIRIGICDDSIEIRNKIKRYIENYNKKYESITFSSGEELLKSKFRFDLIFLDIDMNGINGIETAKLLRNKDKEVKIVYVTSYSEYTNLAFKVHAFGYINKPINKEDIDNILEDMNTYSIREEREDEEIEFISEEGVIRLRLKDIYYFEYIARNIIIKTNKQNYKIKEKITNIKMRMEKYDFVMPHKSFVVNLYNVRSVKGYDIHMMNGECIPLSQKKSSEFRERLNIFLEKSI